MDVIGELGAAFFGALYDFRIPIAILSLIAAVGLIILARRRGWAAVARRHPRSSGALLVAVLAVALPVGWYIASPLFLSTTIDEAAPVVAVASSAPAPSDPSASAPAISSPAPSSAASAPALTPAPPTATPEPTATPAPLLALSGPFHGSDEFHFGRGTARLIETAPGRYVVRLENFAVRNGPDLYVYISPSADGYANGAIELGKLKADRGNQNYPVPAGALTDPTRAKSVVIWCKQFSHLFATAPLAG